MHTLTLHSADELDRALHWVQRCLEDQSIPNPVILDLKVVLDELIANTFLYGLAQQQNGWLKIDLELGNACLNIILHDNGAPFDPTQHHPSDLSGSISERPIGGLGLILVEKLTDSQQYQRDAEQNILTLTKLIN